MRARFPVRHLARRLPKLDRRIVARAAFTASILLAFADVGLAQKVDPALWTTSGGGVGTLVRDGGLLYIGGNFNRVGPATGCFVAIDTSTGVVQQPYPKVVGRVDAMVPDGDGGWYLGGAFTAVDGQSRHNLAHIDSHGRTTPWNPDADLEVRAIAVSEGRVFVGGDFTSINGQPRSSLAALDAQSGAVSSWDPHPTYDSQFPIAAQVDALLLSGGTVYVGGFFNHIGGQSRNRIAALDAVSGEATPWNPDANVTVFSLAPSPTGAFVFAGGGFGTIGGQPRSHIAALDTATGAATAWNPGASGAVYAMALESGRIFAGGEFLTIGGQQRNHVAALDPVSGAVSPWNPGADRPVYSFATSGSVVYVGGNFTTIGGQPRANIAALDQTTGLATPWDPHVTGPVYALAVNHGSLFAGGEYSLVGGLTRNNIAALDVSTGVPTAWDPNANSAVYSLAVSGGTVYAGGGFTTIGGQPRHSIAALDAETGTATAWNPGTDGFVYSLAIDAGTIYAAGTFNHIGAQPRSNIAALDAATGAATAWDPGADNEVHALSVRGATVYAGGFFTSIGGQARHGLAALDAASGAATTWDPNPGDPGADVRALAANDDVVYVGGLFSSIGGQPRRNIAALDASSGTATPWDPDASDGVNALAVSNGTVYAGGLFTSMGGQPRLAIAALDAVTGAPTAWNPSAIGSVGGELPGNVGALAASQDAVYAGGGFYSVFTQPNSNLASFSVAPASASTNGPGAAVGALTAGPNPTRGGVEIQYTVSAAGRVRLELLDLSGRVVETLEDGIRPPGHHVTQWDGFGRRGKVAPGLYFIRLNAPNQTMVKRLAVFE